MRHSKRLTIITTNKMNNYHNILQLLQYTAVITIYCNKGIWSTELNVVSLTLSQIFYCTLLTFPLKRSSLQPDLPAPLLVHLEATLKLITWTQRWDTLTVDLITKTATKWLTGQEQIQPGCNGQKDDSWPRQIREGWQEISSGYSEHCSI